MGARARPTGAFSRAFYANFNFIFIYSILYFVLILSFNFRYLFSLLNLTIFHLLSIYLGCFFHFQFAHFFILNIIFFSFEFYPQKRENVQQTMRRSLQFILGDYLDYNPHHSSLANWMHCRSTIRFYFAV